MHRVIALMLAAACGGGSAPTVAKPAEPENAELAAMVAGLDEALAQRPDDGVLLLLRAAYGAELGRVDEALAFVARLDAIGWDVPFAPTDFTKLHGDPRFVELAARIAARSPVVSGSQPAFTIAGKDVIPEGIAVDPDRGTFYVGSIRKRMIFAIDPDGAVRTFVPAARDGLSAVLGLKVDTLRGVLWATSFGTEGMEGFDAKADAGRSELSAFGLADGSLRRRIAFPAGAEPHLLNDVAVGKDGNVYVTDSVAGAVWRVAPGRDVFETLVAPGTFAYPNGIAELWNGKLAVAHGTGIAIVDPATGRFERMANAPGRPLGGIDGLLRDGATLYAVQNGLGVPRIVAIELDDAGAQATALRVLENDPATLEIPTTSALYQGALYTIANAQLDALGPEGLRAGRELHDPRIVRTPIGK